MFSTISSCHSPYENEIHPQHLMAFTVDIVSGAALLVIGSLVASGSLALSPAASYAMVGIGCAQLSPFIAISLSYLAEALRSRLGYESSVSYKSYMQSILRNSSGNFNNSFFGTFGHSRSEES